MRSVFKLFTDRDNLLKHSSLLVAASMSSSLLNMLFQVVMSRRLSNPEFADLYSMLGVLMLISVPAGAIQMAIMTYTSRFAADQQPALIGELCGRALRRLTVWVVPAAAAGLMLSPMIASYFNIRTVWPVAVTVLVCIANIYGAIAQGLLQGTQSFGLTAVLHVVMGGTRLLVGAGLVVIGWGATGGLLGGLVSTVLGLAIALGMTGRMHGIGFGARRQGVDSSEVYVYFWPVLISCAVIAVMMNADVMIVKKFFAGEQAGVYSKASLIARMIAYVSGPIVVAMAPKVAGQVAGAAFAARTFLRAVALCVLVTVCASGVCWLFPSLPLRILADSDDAALYPLVRLFVWAFAPMPVLFMLINFLMARTSFRFLLVVAPLSLAYVVSLWLRHPSYEAIVTTLGFAGLLVTLITAGFSWREIRRTDAGAVSGG